MVAVVVLSYILFEATAPEVVIVSLLTVLEAVATFTVGAPALVKTMFPEQVPNVVVAANLTQTVVVGMVPAEPTVNEVANPLPEVRGTFLLRFQEH